MKAEYLQHHKDDEAVEVDKFTAVLAANYKNLSGDAVYHLNKIRQVKLHRPAELPSQTDMTRLKQYTVDRMQQLTTDTFLMWNSSAFAELRDLALCRLTLFNGRRGNKPARLRVADWEDVQKRVWVNPAKVEQLSEV